MKGTITREHIRQVLLDIDPLVRQYHRNVAKIHTGIDHMESNELGLKESIGFLKRIWGSCLDWGNQRIDFIGKSVQQLSDFLNLFHSKKEIHDLFVFLDSLEKYPTTKRITPVSQDDVVRLTELLPKFHSVGIKTAALIMRFLCLDCSFFSVDTGKLIPPLDRVNYRMCEQFFSEAYILKKLGEFEDSFDKKAHFGFAEIGRSVLGKDHVLIDNLWFIGHFYHYGRNRKDCNVRDGAKIVDYPYLRSIIHKLPGSCPFSAYGCKRFT